MKFILTLAFISFLSISRAQLPPLALKTCGDTLAGWNMIDSCRYSGVLLLYYCDSIKSGPSITCTFVNFSLHFSIDMEVEQWFDTEHAADSSRKLAEVIYSYGYPRLDSTMKTWYPDGTLCYEQGSYSTGFWNKKYYPSGIIMEETRDTVIVLGKEPTSFPIYLGYWPNGNIRYQVVDGMPPEYPYRRYWLENGEEIRGE